MSNTPMTEASSASAKRPKIRIIVLCDGTAQQRDWVNTVINQKTSVDQSGNIANVPTTQSGDYFTNVALLANMITSSSAPGEPRTAAGPQKDSSSSTPPIPQIVYYQPGVGTTSTFFANMVEQGTGSSVGRKIRDAYSFVCDNYQDGDELFFFGFSRGAYIARCITGMINWCGVLSKKQMNNFAAIWGAYQKRDPEKIETDDEAAEVLRAATGQYPSLESEQTATNMFAFNLSKTSLTKGEQVKILQERQDLCANRRERRSIPPIKVVGVWDTVCALGFPGLFYKDKVKFFSFYDPGLGSNIEYAFHALSLEEDRRDFLPTLWYKPNTGLTEAQRELNTQAAVGVQELSSRASSSAASREASTSHQQVLKQCWFQGVHTDLGGGYQHHGLSDIALIWMVSQLIDPHSQDGGGETPGNLLNINLKQLKSVLDKRRDWGCQLPHRSRPTLNFQQARTVHQRVFDPASMKRAVWATISEGSRTFESIHPSVLTSGRIQKETHKAFAEVRKEDPDKLEKMWEAATPPAGSDIREKLRPTEISMYWGKANTSEESNPTTYNSDRPNGTPSANAVGDITFESTSAATTLKDPSKELGENPMGNSKLAKVWQWVYDALALPNMILVVNPMNFRFVPRANLRPTALQNAWWSLGAKFS